MEFFIAFHNNFIVISVRFCSSAYLIRVCITTSTATHRNSTKHKHVIKHVDIALIRRRWLVSTDFSDFVIRYIYIYIYISQHFYV